MSKDFGSFKFLTGDCCPLSYGAKWYRKVAENRYHIIELMLWANHVSEAEVKEVGKYNVGLSEIDLDVVGDNKVRNALECCGIEIDEYEPKLRTLITVEACHSYGARAPLFDESGNNARALMRAARALSRSLDDTGEHAKAMAKPVNRIGSTAEEYMKGDVTSAILRGVEAGDKNAEIMLKLGVR